MAHGAWRMRRSKAESYVLIRQRHAVRSQRDKHNWLHLLELVAQLAMCVRVVAFFALCVLPIPCEGFAPATSGEAILCKTVETFKLADLYHLELTIKASSCGMACRRVGVDPATGSSLLLLTEGEPSKTAQATHHEHLAIGQSPSVEWFGIEVASACDAKTLVSELQQRAGEIETMMRDQAASGSNTTGSQDITWTLEYTRMGNGDVGEKDRPRHTSKTLCYGVANALTLPPELEAKSNGESSHLVLLDGPDKIRLCLVTSRDESGVDRNCKNGNADIVRKVWPSRPFQYSSAMNPTAAAIVVDVLLSMCRKGKGINETPTLLDPTCGSGTFLAFALAHGAKVIGWDINESCCEGTRRNLDYLKASFVGEGLELSSSDQISCRVERQDAAFVTIDKIGKTEIDCVVANLPWGHNTPTYYEENNNILQSLTGLLRPGVPVAIISRDSSIQKDIERLGFGIVGTASIPQSNFCLPKTFKKKAKKRKEIGGEGGGENANDCGRNQSISSSTCVITIAVTS